MPSLSPDQLPKLVSDAGYEIITSRYNPRAGCWREFARMIPLQSMRDTPYGHRWVGVGTDAYPLDYEDGQARESSTFGEGYARQIANKKRSREIGIPYDMLDSANARLEIINMVGAWTESFTDNVELQKDGEFAGMLQKGTLSAGNVQYFDERYRATADISLGKIYDAKPWFAASGNAHPGKFFTVSGNQGINLDASLTLTSANFDTAFVMATNYNAFDETGREITLQPTHLVGGSLMRGTIHSVLQSQNLPGTANNDINYNKGLLQPKIFDRLVDDANAWWLLTAGRSVVACDSGAPVLRTVRDDRRNTLWLSAEYRFGMAVDDWRYAHSFAKAVS